MQFPALHLKRVTTGKEIARLIIATVICTFFVLPVYFIVAPTSIDLYVAALVLNIVFELLYLLIIFMPIALGLLGLFYLVTRNPKKKFEYASYGYLLGLAIGFVLLLSTKPFYNVTILEGLAAIGFAACIFAAGIGLSFISNRPRKIL